MNRLPSPFSSNIPTVLTPQNSSSSSSPGFLMLTRPPSASSDPSGRNRNMNHRSPQAQRGHFPSPQRQRGHYPNHSPTGFVPSPQRQRGHYPNPSPTSFAPSPQGQWGQFPNNHPAGFSPIRNQGNFCNRSPYAGNLPNHHFRTPSPNTSYTNHQNSSDQSYLQSTPVSSGKNLFQQKQQGHHDTPLKSIPIEKFVSANMVKDPWEKVQNFSTVVLTLSGDEASESESQSIDSPSRVSDNSDVELV